MGLWRRLFAKEDSSAELEEALALAARKGDEVAALRAETETLNTTIADLRQLNDSLSVSVDTLKKLLDKTEKESREAGKMRDIVSSLAERLRSADSSISRYRTTIRALNKEIVALRGAAAKGKTLVEDTIDTIDMEKPFPMTGDSGPEPERRQSVRQKDLFTEPEVTGDSDSPTDWLAPRPEDSID